jgi:hypothetical protein
MARGGGLPVDAEAAEQVTAVARDVVVLGQPRVVVERAAWFLDSRAS